MNRLADELRVVRDVMDDVREDLSWVTRNGISGQATHHTRVVRMARDPLAPDAAAHLELRTYTLEPKSVSGISPEVFDELVAEIAEAMTVVGQEQLNMFLTALDDARTKLMSAIKQPVAPAATKDTSVAEPSVTKQEAAEAHITKSQPAKPRRAAGKKSASLSSKPIEPVAPVAPELVASPEPEPSAVEAEVELTSATMECVTPTSPVQRGHLF